MRTRGGVEDLCKGGAQGDGGVETRGWRGRGVGRGEWLKGGGRLGQGKGIEAQVGVEVRGKLGVQGGKEGGEGSQVGCGCWRIGYISFPRRERLRWPRWRKLSRESNSCRR